MCTHAKRSHTRTHCVQRAAACRAESLTDQPHVCACATARRPVLGSALLSHAALMQMQKDRHQLVKVRPSAAMVRATSLARARACALGAPHNRTARASTHRSYEQSCFEGMEIKRGPCGKTHHLAVGCVGCLGPGRDCVGVGSGGAGGQGVQRRCASEAPVAMAVEAKA